MVFRNYFKYLFFVGLYFLIHPNSIAQNTRSALPAGTETFVLSGLFSSLNPSFVPPAGTRNAGPPLPAYLRQKNYSEIISQRTLKSRTFKGESGELLMHTCSKNIHYPDKENKLQPISGKLQISEKGWSAPQQPFPTYLFKDGSVAISSDETNKIIFNKDGRINGQELNLSDFTVGEDGMYINDVFPDIDKKIIFSENQIKTDYVINKPLNITQDLLISEEIEFPEGYSINPAGGQGYYSEIIIYSPNGKESARFNPPFFYDAKQQLATSSYSIIQKEGKTTLQFSIPVQWLNAPERIYPIIIDPLVTGPVSNYPPIYLNSCEYPNFETDSMLVTIPPGITITYFNVEDSYYADVNVGALMLDGYMMLSTACGSFSGSCDSSQSGTCYWIPGIDFKTQLACCFEVSCDTQTFYLTHGFARTPAIYGTGCNQNSVYYSPNGLWPFSAYIEGRTVEISPAPPWSVFPATVCSDSCTIYLKAKAQYGVPPYTMTHPWSSDTIVFGASSSSCSSFGIDTIALTIPGCPGTCDSVITMSVPPPLIIDLCGDTVTGLSPKTITINPVPVATAVPVSICSGEQVNINVSSCIPGSSYTWTGSNGSSGIGNINDNPVVAGPDTVNYSVIPSSGGCTGQPATVSAEIYPVYSVPVSAEICSGKSIFLQGNNQTTSGTYYDTFSTVNGCDSVIVTILTVTEISSTASASICSGTSTFLQGNYQTTPGTYYDTVSTADGCDSVIITTLTVTDISSSVSAAICDGESIFLQGNYQTSPGTYYDTLTTATGCDSAVATGLTVYPLPLIVASPDTMVFAGEPAHLSVTGGLDYVWSTGHTSSSFSISPVSTTVFTVTGTDSNDCSSTDMVIVNVVEVPKTYHISVPNIFTPNGDNGNDYVFVHGNGIREFRFSVFDRLGEKVFETDDKSVGWDGTYKGKPLNSAVFAYLLTAVFEDGSEHKEKGSITLLR